MAQSTWRLDQIEVSEENFPPELYITKLMKNPIYRTPSLILPPTKAYEIDVRSDEFS